MDKNPKGYSENFSLHGSAYTVEDACCNGVGCVFRKRFENRAQATSDQLHRTATIGQVVDASSPRVTRHEPQACRISLPSLRRSVEAGCEVEELFSLLNCVCQSESCGQGYMSVHLRKSIRDARSTSPSGSEQS